MCIISISFSGNRLLQALSFLFSNNKCVLYAAGSLSVDKEVLIDIFGDFFIMVVDGFLVLRAFLRETRTFGVVEVEFAFSDGLHFSGTAVEIYVRVAAWLHKKVLLAEEC